MPRFGRSQRQSLIREAELARIPHAADLRNMLATAQRNWQKSIELPFHTADSPVRLTLVVKCEQYGKDVAFWSLYRTDITGSPAIWTEQTIRIDLITNLVELGYSTAVEAERRYQGEGVTPSTESVTNATNAGDIAVEVPSDAEDPLYLEALHGLSLSDEDFAIESALVRAAAELDEASSGATPSVTVSPEAEHEGFSAPEPLSFDQSLARSKERKQQALTGVILKLAAAADVSSCAADIMEAVRLVINPFDTGTISSTIAHNVERDLKALIKLHGDKELSNSLANTFTALLKAKSAPAESEIEKITSKWFW